MCRFFQKHQKSQVMVEYKTKVSGGTLVIKLKGEMISAELDGLASGLDGVLNDSEKSKLLINLAAVTRMDSAGIGFILVYYRKAVIKQHLFALCGLKGSVSKAVKAAELDKLVDVYPSEKEALARL